MTPARCTSPLAVALTLLCSQAAQAVLWTGNHSSSPNWDAFILSGGFIRYTNWQGSPTFPPAGVPVEFGDQYAGGGFASGVPALNGTRIVTSLAINHTGNQTILTGGSGQSLQITSGNLTRLSTSSGFQTIDASIVQSQAGTWDIDGTGRLDILGVISGSAFTKDGPGTLELEGASANVYSGQTTVSDGTLRLWKSAGVVAIPGNLVIRDATVEFGAGSSEQIADTATVALNDGGALLYIGPATETFHTLDLNFGTVQLIGGELNVTDLNASTGSILLGGGALSTTTLDGTAAINFGAGGQLTASSGVYSGVLSGTGNLTKQGGGKLVLSAANPLVGTATINDGQVEIDNGNALEFMDVVVNTDLGLTTSVAGAIYRANSLTLNAAHFNGGRSLTVADGVVLNSGGSLDLVAGSVLNVQGDAGIQVSGGTLVRDSSSTINLNGTVKQIAVLNGGLLDYTGPTTIGAGVAYDLQSSSTFRSRGNLTVDGGTLSLDASTVDARPLQSTLGGANGLPGFTLELAGSTVAVHGGVLSFGGGMGVAGNSSSLGDGGDGGSGGSGGAFVMSDGTFTLDAAGLLDLGGGAGGDGGVGATFDNGEPGGDGGDGGKGGVGGALTISGGVATFSGGAMVNLRGGTGGDFGFLGNGNPRGSDGVGNDGGNGGALTVTGGTLNIAGGGTIDLRGGDAQDRRARGGIGGKVKQTAGTLVIDGGAIDLTGGLDAAPGSVSLSGGTLRLNAGLITGDSSTVSTATTPVIVHQTAITATGGTIDLNANLTLDGADLTLTGAATKLDAGHSGSGQPGRTIAQNNGSIILTDGSLLAAGSNGGTQIFFSEAGGRGGSLTSVNANNSLSGSALLDLHGGSGASSKTGGRGGTMTIEGGATTVGGSSVLNFRGGNGGGVGSFGGAGGGASGGTLTFTGGNHTFEGDTTVLLYAGNGGAGGTSGLNSYSGAGGGVGGTVTFAAGSATIRGAVVFDLSGGRGGNGTTGFSGTGTSGGSGGAGGTLIVAGGDATIVDTGLLVLNGGNGGNGGAGGFEGKPGGDGRPGGSGGRLDVTGGSLTLGGGVMLELAGGNGGVGGSGGPKLSGGSGPAGQEGAGGTGGIVSQSGGTLVIDGGTIDLTGGSGSTNGAAGSVDLSGGTLELNAGLITGENSTTPTSTDPITLHQAPLNIAGGDAVASAPMSIEGSDARINLSAGSLTATTISETSGGDLVFTGGTLTADNYEGVLVQDGGTLLIGGSPGAMSISQDYTQNAGTLDIELGGLTQGTSYDWLDVAGDLNLAGGSLDVSLIAPFDLNPLKTFDIVSVGGTLTGQFVGLAEGGLVASPGGTNLYITYQGGNGNDIALFTTSGLDGDYNNDGFVNIADYTVWRDNLGAPEGTLLNDPNVGTIAAAQYTTWKNNFGNSLPFTVASATIPEPSSCVLLALLATAGVCRLVRRGH